MEKNVVYIMFNVYVEKALMKINYSSESIETESTFNKDSTIW